MLVASPSILALGPASFIALGLALSFWIGFCDKEASLAKSVIKTGSVVLLAYAAWRLGGAPYLVWALLLCALGDFFLSLEGDTAFMAGVGAFAAGHIAYVVLCLNHPLANPARMFAVEHAMYVAILVLLGISMIMVLWRRAGALRIPVVLYVPIVLAMGFCVLTLQAPDTAPVGQAAFGRLAWWAALLFILSDLTLAFHTFVFEEESDIARITPYIVWPTYWGAQFLFLIAFLGLGAQAA